MVAHLVIGACKTHNAICDRTSRKHQRFHHLTNKRISNFPYLNFSPINLINSCHRVSLRRIWTKMFFSRTSCLTFTNLFSYFFLFAMLFLYWKVPVRVFFYCHKPRIPFRYIIAVDLIQFPNPSLSPQPPTQYPPPPAQPPSENGKVAQKFTICDATLRMKCWPESIV